MSQVVSCDDGDGCEFAQAGGELCVCERGLHFKPHVQVCILLCLHARVHSRAEREREVLIRTPGC